jgi:hypothetical protein
MANHIEMWRASHMRNSFPNRAPPCNAGVMLFVRGLCRGAEPVINVHVLAQPKCGTPVRARLPRTAGTARHRAPPSRHLGGLATGHVSLKSAWMS